MGIFEQVSYNQLAKTIVLSFILGIQWGYAQPRIFRLPSGITSADYLPGEIVLKIRSTNAVSARSATSAASVMAQVERITQAKEVTPVLRPSRQLNKQARQESTTEIYRIRTSQDVIATINQLLQLDEVVYAEPYYLLRPLDEYIPNDSEAAKNGQQDYLETVQAYEAWAMERGNKNMLIGYLDTGVEFGHQDLADNLYYNEADPINGIDDDQDGYIDNYVGWDFANDDNDPTADFSDHGTMVAGVGSASPDNRVGIAGLGFNASYIPIKIFRSEDNLFGFGYEAIAYAADKGCKVINLSWGGANAYSQFGQDMINYAVLEKDAVVIAAAGNSGKQENFYPASFDNVLSVAVSDANGNKVNQTTKSYFVDLLAPGNSNYTTKNDDSYGNGSGSSFASPLVAGVAALVRSRYPELSAQQVMEVLRLSTKDVSAQSKNQAFKETLGRGFIQAAKALKPLNSPALRLTTFNHQNQAGAFAYYGDTLTISIDVQNLLSPTSANTQITLSTVSEYVTVLDSVFLPGAIDSLGTASNAAQPFRVVLSDDLPTNQQLMFRLGMEDGAYQDYQYFFIVSSSGYPTITKNDLQITVGSEGCIGYDPTGMSLGGVRYQNQAIATAAGLLLGIDSAHVSDNLVNNFATLSREQDFMTEENIRFSSATLPAYQLRSAFSDKNATNPLSLRIEQTWLADTTNTQNYLVSEYRVVNQADSTQSDVAVGLFANWNIEDTEANRTGWDTTYQLGYTYDAAEQTYAGLALLTDQAVNYQALDLQSLNGNTADIGEEISERDKYVWASEGVEAEPAGAIGAGNDVAQVLAASVDSIPTGRAAKVAFAWVAGASLAEIQSAVARVQQWYERYREAPELLFTQLVCTDSSATIQLEATHRFYQDALGTIFLAESTQFTTGAISQDTAIYVASLESGYEGRIQQISIEIQEPVATFSVVNTLNPGWQNDTLFLDETNNHLLTFQDNSQHAVTWRWDFGNGYRSTQQHPQTSYFQPGTYTVELTVASEPGCIATYSQEITVVQRAMMPQISDKLICGGSSTTLQAVNTSQIKVFADSTLRDFLYQGEEFTSQVINQNTTFYVVNAEGEIDSQPLPVLVEVWQPALEISYALDTTDLSSKYSLMIELTGETNNISQYHWYVNNSLVSQQPVFTHDFSDLVDEDWQLRLDYSVDSADLTCTYSLEKTIPRTQSPQPDLSARRICRGEPVTLAPTNGELFYFYQDADLTIPLHAGKTLMLDSVAMNTTIYVTNLDGLIESEATAVAVEINRFADFKTLADTVYLSEPDMAVLQAFALDEGDPEISWQWDLGDGSFNYQSARVVPQFDSAGVYPIRLLATRSDGCTNLISKTVVVRNVASMQVDPEDQALKVYPNPVRDVFYLENLMWFQKDITISLLSLEGQVVLHKQLFYREFPLPIYLSQLTQPLTPGIYVLRLQRDDKVFQRKLVIE